MKVAVFSTKPYDEKFLGAAAKAPQHELVFFEPRLNEQTVSLAAGYPAVCAFVNDQLTAPVLTELSSHGTRLIAMRSAGFNNVDVRTAQKLGLKIMRVPAYSPYAVAEHTVALMLALNRRIHKAYNHVREGNFALEGMMGFDMVGRTAGIVGTGKIGSVVARILHGFGCKLLAYDLRKNPEVEALGARYVSLNEIFSTSDIVTLHCPLMPETYHLINAQAVQEMKKGVMLINTSRGALIDTKAVVNGLKSGKIGHLGLDVYEEESDLFFEDLSTAVIQDDTFSRLLTFPNVVITGHQAFFTQEALTAIAETTMKNITDFEHNRPSPNEVALDPAKH